MPSSFVAVATDLPCSPIDESSLEALFAESGDGPGPIVTLGSGDFAIGRPEGDDGFTVRFAAKGVCILLGARLDAALDAQALSRGGKAARIAYDEAERALSLGYWEWGEERASCEYRGGFPIRYSVANGLKPLFEANPEPMDFADAIVKLVIGERALTTRYLGTAYHYALGVAGKAIAGGEPSAAAGSVASGSEDGAPLHKQRGRLIESTRRILRAKAEQGVDAERPELRDASLGAEPPFEYPAEPSIDAPPRPDTAADSGGEAEADACPEGEERSRSAMDGDERGIPKGVIIFARALLAFIVLLLLVDAMTKM
jgi:hypothetical protein